MGLRFRKSVKIAPGVRLNLNKNSTSVSFGGKGAHYTVSSNGRRTASVGIPGTGISYSASTSSGKGGKARDTAKSSGGSSSGRGDNDKNGCLWLLLGIALLPILLTYWLWTRIVPTHSRIYTRSAAMAMPESPRKWPNGRIAMRNSVLRSCYPRSAPMS